MNEDRKKRGLANSNLLIAMAITALIIGSSNAMANQTASGSSYKVTEQMQIQTVTGVVVDANGLGIASMILGIVAILLACCAGGKWLTFFVAAAGLILGIIALQKPKYGSSRGMALAGVICSVIALLMKIIVIILLGVGIGSFLYSHMFHF